MLLAGVAAQNASAGGQRHAGVAGRFHAVGQYLVDGAAQPLHAVDGNHAAGAQFDNGAHALQHHDEVDDLGFGGSVLNDGAPFGQHSCQQDVFGSTYTRVGEADARSLQAVRSLGDEGALAFFDACAHGAQGV